MEFTRTMNRVLFDKTVTSQPGTFPFVTLPDPHVEVVPKKGESREKWISGSPGLLSASVTEVFWRKLRLFHYILGQGSKTSAVFDVFRSLHTAWERPG